MADETYFARYRGCGFTLAMAGNTINPLFLVKIRRKNRRFPFRLLFLYGKKRPNDGDYGAKAENPSKHRMHSFLM